MNIATIQIDIACEDMPTNYQKVHELVEPTCIDEEAKKYSSSVDRKYPASPLKHLG